MAVQDPVGMEWAAKLMASLRRDADPDAPRPEPLPGEPGDGLPEMLLPDSAPNPEPDPEPDPAPHTGMMEPPGEQDFAALSQGLLATLNSTATATAPPAILESPLLGSLRGAKPASVLAPPDEPGRSFAEASPLLASVRAREAPKPAAEPALPAVPAPIDAAPEPAADAGDASPAEPEPAAEQAPCPASAAVAEIPDPPEVPVEQPDLPGDIVAPVSDAEPATTIDEPAKPVPVAPAAPAGQAAPATSDGTRSAQPSPAAEGPGWMAVQQSLGTARSVWSALFLGGAATTTLPLQGALAARARDLAPVLHVTESNVERMARLRSALAAESLVGAGTNLVTTAVETDPARLGLRTVLAQDLLDAAETWDLVRIGLPGITGALLALDMPLLTRKVRWLMLAPNSRAEEAEALCHLLRARWRLAAERPAMLNTSAPAVAQRPGLQLWRGPLD